MYSIPVIRHLNPVLLHETISWELDFVISVMLSCFQEKCYVSLFPHLPTLLGKTRRERERESVTVAY